MKQPKTILFIAVFGVFYSEFPSGVDFYNFALDYNNCDEELANS
jgi:hypothetical protein